MRSTLEIEGTWEEILTNANEFSGKRVRLTLLEQSPNRESDLLKEINLGISADIWTEYHQLIAKRQAEIMINFKTYLRDLPISIFARRSPQKLYT